MKIVAVPALKDNYIWMLTLPEKGIAIAIDPGEVEPVTTYLQQQNLRLVAILITHHHWDHTNGVAALAQQYQVPVYAPLSEKIPTATHLVKEGESFIIDHFPTFNVLSIPGHTLEHIAYYVDDALFCGDTLFAAGCGRIFEGTPPQMYASLNKIANLPEETRIYCAHEYTLNNLRFAQVVEPNNAAIETRMLAVTRLNTQNLPSLPSRLYDEKMTNPFLRCTSAEVIANVSAHVGRELPSELEVFTELRKWKDGF